MNTDDLIRALAADGATAKGRWSAGSQIAAAALISLATVVVLVVFTFGVRPDLPDALVTPAGIAKFVLSFALAAAACIALARAVEPGRPARLEATGIAVAGVLAVGVVSAITTTDAALTGSSLDCVASILALSALPLAALIMALRNGASTNPHATGAVAGLAAGAIAAFGFGLSCPMDLGPYVVLWYSLAIIAAGALGMLAGRRALAW
ncbi:MAG: NrsF family protein [Beijerinckiaceae bacterium]